MASGRVPNTNIIVFISRYIFYSRKVGSTPKAKSSLMNNANRASPTLYHISVQIPPFNGIYDRFGFPFKGTETPAGGALLYTQALNPYHRD